MTEEILEPTAVILYWELHACVYWTVIFEQVGSFTSSSATADNRSVELSAVLHWFADLHSPTIFYSLLKSDCEFSLWDAKKKFREDEKWDIWIFQKVNKFPASILLEFVTYNNKLLIQGALVGLFSILPPA